MPVGNGAVPELLPTPEQREKMYHKIREYRQIKPIFGIDFQNDGEFVEGCVAGGRRYFHINAKGDAEPCVFIHYSNANVHDTSILMKKQFYKMQKEGAFACTSQISPETYRACFEPYLEAGEDVLYFGFSSGMSGTMNSAFICKQELEEEYPERKIICVDTLCGSVGEALLVVEALKKQEEGMDIEELARWAGANCLDVCHWFMVDTIDKKRE